MKFAELISQPATRRTPGESAPTVPNRQTSAAFVKNASSMLSEPAEEPRWR
jgi:hypothetical protein